jgi:[ribosomal protein S5]-alanine N-acetyltransferase
MSIIKTPRLTLRHFTLDDAAFFMALVNDKDWLAYIGDRDVHSVQAARDYLEKFYLPKYDKDGFGFYLVALKTTNEPIGMCGLIKREGLNDADIGFAYLPAYRGFGYALEAARATLVYARDALFMRRLVAIATPSNASSIKLLEKLGLVFESYTTLPKSDEQLALYAINLRAGLPT